MNRSGCSGVAKDGGSSPRNAVDVLQVLKFGNNPITFRLLRSSSLDDEYLSQAISLNIAVTTHSCLVARQHEGVCKHFNQCVAAGVNGYSNWYTIDYWWPFCYASRVLPPIFIIITLMQMKPGSLFLL